MEASESPGTQSRTRRPVEQDGPPQDAPVRDAEVAAFLPLALLVSVRSHDRPEEVLEDENLTVSLPRRLGLSDVIHTQIRRYEEETRKGRTVRARELVDLIRLVIRRPDAEEILDEAGRGVVTLYLEGMGERRAKVARMLPRPLGRSALVRRARMLGRRIAAGADSHVEKAPLRIRLRDSITAEVDPGGAACGLYTSTFKALAARYLRTEPGVEHNLCSARGDEACEWTVHE